MNKKRRLELTFLKYKKRIERWVHTNCGTYRNRDGVEIQHPKTVDVIKDRGQLVYKTTSVPCSCYSCSGYYKYRRKDFKKETLRILKEEFEESCSWEQRVTARLQSDSASVADAS